MLHHAVSYDPTRRHLDLYGKLNDQGIYHYFLTGNNMCTLHFYQVLKTCEARHDYKVKAGWFWYKRLNTIFTQNLVLEANFESSDNESDTKDDRTISINIKEGGNGGNGQVADLDV